MALGRDGEEGWYPAEHGGEHYGRDVAVKRKVRAEIFVFLAKQEMGATMRMIALGCFGWNRGPLSWGQNCGKHCCSLGVRVRVSGGSGGLKNTRITERT